MSLKLLRPSSLRFCRWNSSFDPTKSFKLSKPPLPEWKLGAGAAMDLSHHQSSVYKSWNLSETSLKDTYRLLTSAIIPRPIALISTLDSDGSPNLAPFSYFSMISHNPPLLSVSFSLSPGKAKDSRKNIFDTGEFTVNLISEHFIEAANSTSLDAPADVNEWLVSGLTMEASSQVKPPRCAESIFHFSHDISDLNNEQTTTTLVLGLIKQVHVRESALSENGIEVNPAELRPVARLGGLTYARLTDGFNLPRLSWKKWGDKVGDMVN
ncbi:hypothetical protein D9757_000654 [Collybiopsis confluens]|uniref:Flavin reductase like domain-containing protein n=1 Tax=Collybiopsis confluens TaxID=2823264 RepID=A0A8H5I1G1_9AGAR|nr:hypothetical protein D9757_000654 [Collybiopsis confluens]